MTKVVLDLDDQTLDRVASLARARSLSVENLIRRHVRDMASLAPIDIVNPSHRAILSVLEAPTAPGTADREELHDRERARAEIYAQNRRRLVRLVDETDGDMGDEGWTRERLDDR